MHVRKNIRPLEMAVALSLFLSFNALPSPAQTSPPAPKIEENSPASPQELYKRLSPSVFVVESLDADGKVIATGSAVAVAPGEVVTNRHVIEDGVSYRLKRGAKTWPATISHLDPDHDLCQLSSKDLAAAAVPLRLSATLSVGERVYAIGAPEGLELTLSEGLISALREFENARLIQTSAPISHGSSGGGLFDSHGRLIGITTFYVKEGQNLNFALPGDWVKTLPSRLSTKKTASEIESAMVWVEIGNKFNNKDNYEDAVNAYKKAIRLKPDYALAWYNLGVVYGKLGRTADAVDAYQEGIRLKPDDAKAWNNLGVAYGKLGRTADQIDAYQEAIRLKPDDAKAWHNLGLVYGNLGRTVDAVKAYQEAIRLKPDDADAWYNLGVAYGKLGRTADAVKAYQEAIRLRPDYAEAWFNLGAAYGILGSTADAVEAYQEAIRLKPDDAEAWNNLGAVYGKLGRTADAVKAFQEAIRLKPDYAMAWYNLGGAYSTQGNRALVIEVYKKLKELNPELADKFFRSAVIP